jgi:DNA-binding transcriptional regulator YdaS (Cro superfamily)
MKLSEYLNSERGRAAKLAISLGVGISYISQMASGYRVISPARASQIETLTGGIVSRREMRPDDWKSIWPDLSEQ